MKTVLYAFFFLASVAFAPAVFSNEHEHEGGGAEGTYKEMAPPFVVNLPDPHQTHFMQIQVAVSASNPVTLNAMDVHAPLLRNNLILLFTSQDRDVIKTKEGRNKLRLDAQIVVNKALKQVGVPPVDALYFTSLVVQ